MNILVYIVLANRDVKKCSICILIYDVNKQISSFISVAAHKWCDYHNTLNFPGTILS